MMKKRNEELYFSRLIIFITCQHGYSKSFLYFSWYGNDKNEDKFREQTLFFVGKMNVYEMLQKLMEVLM